MAKNETNLIDFFEIIIKLKKIIAKLIITLNLISLASSLPIW